MKKTFLFACMFCIVFTNSQTTVFEETFQTAIDPSLPTGWTSGDLDGSGLSWITADSPAISNPMGFSEKVVGSPEAAPDNLLISPIVNLPSGSNTLNFLIGTSTQNDTFDFDNHYAVYVLPSTSVFATNATPLLEQTISAGDTAFSQSVTIPSSLAGQQVIIYFRHFNSPNKGPLVIDTVTVLATTLSVTETENKIAADLYPNPSSDFIYIKTKSEISKMSLFDVSGKK